ncbi:MAG: ribosome small subunit-dependent GTPase A [Bacteroidetes bacterium GWD2_45_23]|nr:MAG: ribosome small subunit-dependent GTPase A [Bacteroidetes bacterium GWC2_46_850]OFX80657.1 MAG: ribosome small subunit-dependent GTPase A [Bacteroidetes bacterium GWC1_47_7]OFX85633.1 MAG: ribosome small subunit-dependent GTPase A [Bacteroidetes bacterium GWD2_45_23]HBB00805.1 ribosome small subunit-dependent GTPase A [Porphyromonadaceae bacterium]HCC19430.1 ribosome small subunit-dependent GTPase A [Porphyromonadaceae bacterium]
MKGRVIKNTGNTYLVRTTSGSDLICKAKGNLRLKGIRSTSPVVVGDMVFMDVNRDGTAFITDIDKRKNYIVRKASNLSKHAHILAANIDLALLCITVRYPETTTVFIDRFLVTAEAYSVPVVLVFNKIDLYNEEEKDYLQALIHLYSLIGYRCMKTSMVTGEGVEEIQEITRDKIILLAGHSGVGKSSIINALKEENVQKTGEISGYHHKGMHTTTYSEMIELDNGGFVIDTPGIKGFGTIDMVPAEVSHYFPEIFKMSKKCKFYNCLHLNEPDCAVRRAVEEHYISESRYHSYLNILEDTGDGKYRT